MKVSIYWLSDVTGKHAATIKKRISEIKRDSDGKVDSGQALEAIYIGGGGTTEEVIRQLNIARKNEIDLDMEIKRGDRIPREDCEEAFNEVVQSISGALKARRNQSLDDKTINDIFDQLRQVGEGMKWGLPSGSAWIPSSSRRRFFGCLGLHGSTQKFSLDFFPPQREMFLELFNPRNREVVFKIASRLTKTMTVLAAIGYFIKESPRKIGVMWPKIGDGEEWSKKQFMGELVDPTPEIAALITDGRGRRLANNTILSKIFPGGYLSIFGANVPGDLRRFKGNFLYADEIDAISITETDEGDQLRQFAVRGSEYPDTVQVYSSFPSLKGQSNIDAKYERSDKRVWEVPCAKCGDPWVMNRKDLRYDKEKTEEAKIECPRCHQQFPDGVRYSMARAGGWRATSDFTGIAGFHANSLLWPHPIDSAKYPGGFLQMLALEEVAAEQADNPERARRVIVNTRDAESYQPEHLQKIEHSALYKRREKYDPREELPAEVVFITFGADLQSNRAEIKFKGWGQRAVSRDEAIKQSWALDYRIVRGSPLQAEFWEKLENVFRNVAWKHPVRAMDPAVPRPFGRQLSTRRGLCVRAPDAKTPDLRLRRRGTARESHCPEKTDQARGAARVSLGNRHARGQGHHLSTAREQRSGRARVQSLPGDRLFQ
jgi:hypothetical protein